MIAHLLFKMVEATYEEHYSGGGFPEISISLSMSVYESKCLLLKNFIIEAHLVHKYDSGGHAGLPANRTIKQLVLNSNSRFS